MHKHDYGKVFTKFSSNFWCMICMREQRNENIFGTKQVNYEPNRSHRNEATRSTLYQSRCLSRSTGTVGVRDQGTGTPAQGSSWQYWFVLAEALLFSEKAPFDFPDSHRHLCEQNSKHDTAYNLIESETLTYTMKVLFKQHSIWSTIRNPEQKP